MQSDSIVIVGIARTPIGKLLGELKDFAAHELGGYAMQAAIQRAQLSPKQIQEVLMGCVLPAGQGQAPARQAALGISIPPTVPCTTINKVCGSGMKSIMLAHDMLGMHSRDVIVAGGMESMTNAPYLLMKARQGYRLGNNQIFDHMMLDGLTDAYEPEKAMGVFAEDCVQQFQFTRDVQDAYAISSFERARAATEKGLFADEITPITVMTKKGEVIINQDEHPFSVDTAKIPQLKPAFIKNGTVTAGNSSSIADGAAALVLMRAADTSKYGTVPIAKIVGHAGSAKAPNEFTTAPIDATQQLLKNINWKIEDVGLFEVNEAFAVVTLAFMHAFKLPRDKINIHGGACALGHPIGASGARILVTLISAMRQNQIHRGIATLCIGGGEATAVAVELCV